jgi:hypothetical protein
MIESRFDPGIEDTIILPIVLVAVTTKYLYRATVSVLVHILDFAFPILLQLARFPLFTLRIIGDGVAALVKGIVGSLPVSGTKRQEWLDAVSRHWSWLRQKISYRAFEEAVHHGFERGMAWVFRKCRLLTPRNALLVIGGAVLWLPVSFGAATAIHAVLIAEAASLPPWMQLLHPLATIVAKSKLLVLPVYPAAWPQAKRHPIVQAMARLYGYVTRLHLVQKTGYRFHQMDHAIVAMAGGLGRAAAHVGLADLFNTLLAGVNRIATWIGNASHTAMTWTVEGLSRIPLIGAIVARYAAHYDAADQQRAERVSEKVSGFFARWSIKFSAEYYEAREKGEAAVRPPVLRG